MPKLTDSQAKALLALHLTGSLGGFQFKTYQSLAKLGLIELGRRVTVTPAGKAWCDQNHMNY